MFITIFIMPSLMGPMGREKQFSWRINELCITLTDRHDFSFCTSHAHTPTPTFGWRWSGIFHRPLYSVPFYDRVAIPCTILTVLRTNHKTNVRYYAARMIQLNIVDVPRLCSSKSHRTLLRMLPVYICQAA